MESVNFNKLSLDQFRWMNEPEKWQLKSGTVEVYTDDKKDFWQATFYNFHHNDGHVFGIDVKDDFTFTACIEADFKSRYDQAGLMIYINDKHWLKAGIEYNDDACMISSVLTNQVSDWATGIFPGDPGKFWLRLTRKNEVICVKYSTDNEHWTLLRLCPFPARDKYFVGLMSCTPLRAGLFVKFSDVQLTEPAKDILHSN